MPPKAPSSSSNKVSKAGIVTTADGDTYIPSSVRADGSVRKEIRIRAGYRPPEDVEVYKNRSAEAWKNRGSDGIPGAEAIDSSSATVAGSKGKNAKRREARRRAKEATVDSAKEEDGEEEEQELGEEKEGAPAEPSQANTEESMVPAATSAAANDDAAKEKLARNLKKKLRQAKDLSARKDGGEALLPEQLEKVIRINELIRQLNSLGLDVEDE